MSNPASFETLENRTFLTATPPPTVVGYLPDYHFAALKSPGSDTLDRINWAALTQINYFSVKPDAATGALPGTAPAPGADPLPAFSTNPDPKYSLDQLSEVVTEAHLHHVKVSIVIGGSGYDDSLTTIAADPTLRVKFADSVQAFANKYHVDGVDLDWELQHPWQYQIDNYGDLIETLRNHTTGLKITAAVYPQKLSIATDANPSGDAYSTFAWQLSPKALANLDQINVMDYDLDYSDNSPVQAAENNMDAMAAYLAGNNIPASKLIFGIPFYGKAGFGWGWQQSDNQAYNTLIDTYNTDHTTPADQTLDQITHQFNNTVLPDDFTQVWHFNSVSDVAAKTKYAIDHHFGGVMAWDIGTDHLTGQNVNDDPYSLLASIGRTVAANYHLSFNFSDLVSVAQHYGQTSGATWDTGDYNNDGQVTFADLVLVAQNYGKTQAAAPVAAAFVPASALATPAKPTFSVKPISKAVL